MELIAIKKELVKLDKDKLIDLISELWEGLAKEMKSNKSRFSSEKAMVFRFAWLLKESLKEEVEIIDFERQLFKDFSDGTYLDLYFEYQNKKIGLEFKFPKKNSKGNSNHTQTRIKIINDIKRLSYLVNHGKIDFGVFLLTTDERGYVLEGNKRKALNFKTYKNTKYRKGDDFPIDEVSSKEKVKCLSDIEFKWNDEEIKTSIAWIAPIFI